MKSWPKVFAVAVVLFAVTPSIWASVVSPQVTEFDTGLEGWILNDLTIGTLDWASTGGNGGGFANFADTGQGRSYLLAPASYLGDWSDLNGAAILSFDHKVLANGTQATALPYRIFLSGPGGQASFASNQTPVKAWQTIPVPILESQWQVTSGSWDMLLSNVTVLRLSIEAMDNATHPLDRDGVDNIRLLSTGGGKMPEPATLCLLAIGSLAILWRRRRNLA